MDEMENNLAAELDKVQTAMNTSKSGKFTESILADKAGVDTDALKSDIAEKLEVKKKELVCFIFPFDFLIFIFLTVIGSFLLLCLVLKDCLMLSEFNGREGSGIGEEMGTSSERCIEAAFPRYLSPLIYSTAFTPNLCFLGMS